MNYLIKDTTLTAIGDAVRAKGNTEDKILVSDLATAISNLPTGGGGGGVEVEPIVLSGECEYTCGGRLGAEYINKFGNLISTTDLTGSRYMFYFSTAEYIPFSLNYDLTKEANMSSMFDNCAFLKEVPEINNAYPSGIGKFFSKCLRLRYLPEDLGKSWNWNEIHTYAYASCGEVFNECYSLRQIPQFFLSNLWGIQTSATYYPYKGMFDYCCVLDEINNVPIHQASITSNMFSYTIHDCYRIKSFTFETNEDGTPKTAKWKNQTLDFSGNIGTAYYVYNITGFNSGITADKEVKDDATYQALKNDPDWFSIDINYSRYNHDSAVETINSLPDCSATGTNTIKFKGQAGALTDGGAINTLTEEEIAVATAKGWTVSLV